MLDAHKAREELEDILKQKEYRVYDESKGLLATWWEEAKRWLSEKLAALFPSIEVSNGAASSILIIVIVVVLLLLVLSVFLLVRHHKRNRMLRKQKPLQSMKELNWSFAQHIKEANRLEALGDYTRSTRHLFLALLLFFHEHKWLEARIWKTNWEYYEELKKGDQQRAEQFFHLAHFFDEVTYGERKVQQQEYRQFHADVMKELGGEGGERSVEKG